MSDTSAEQALDKASRDLGYAIERSIASRTGGVVGTMYELELVPAIRAALEAARRVGDGEEKAKR